MKYLWLLSFLASTAFAKDVQSMSCRLSPFGMSPIVVNVSLDVETSKSQVVISDETRDFRNPVKTAIASKASRNGSGYEVSFKLNGSSSLATFDLIPSGMSGVTEVKVKHKNKTKKLNCGASRNPGQPNLT